MRIEPISSSGPELGALVSKGVCVDVEALTAQGQVALREGRRQYGLGHEETDSPEGNAEGGEEEGRPHPEGHHGPETDEADPEGGEKHARRGRSPDASPRQMDYHLAIGPLDQDLALPRQALGSTSLPGFERGGGRSP